MDGPIKIVIFSHEPILHPLTACINQYEQRDATKHAHSPAIPHERTTFIIHNNSINK